MDGILAAYMVPHPPMIIPAVGRGSESRIAETSAAYRRVAEEIAGLAPETIVFLSPHATMYADYFHISPGRSAKGSFADFRASDVKFEEKYDEELADEICAAAALRDFPAGVMGERDRKLDHGTMVPLWFIRNAYSGGKIVRIGLSGLPLSDHYRFGMMIAEAVRKTGRRTVIIASGDLSHKLRESGPYGFAPEGPVYDEKVMDVCSRGAFGELLDFDETFCEKAAECGHRSFVIMAGIFDGVNVRAERLSHQDVTGVGYGICMFYPVGESEERHFLSAHLEKEEAELAAKREGSDEYVRLARSSVEYYVLHHKMMELPDGLPGEMLANRAGAFVSLHEHGKLRGCIGTTEATADCIAREIIRNAVSACSRDPRFAPVREDELKWLEISVDVLGAPERISSAKELDVKKYGVIVSRGNRRGLLLPDLDGVDTVEEQISIAMRKAGIHSRDGVTLERFEVVRHI